MAKKKKQKKKNTPSKQPVVSRPKDFLDLIAPAAVKFNTDHFILGGTYRSVVALRSYPPTTEELALLRRLGEMLVSPCAFPPGELPQLRRMLLFMQPPTRTEWSAVISVTSSKA